MDTLQFSVVSATKKVSIRKGSSLFYKGSASWLDWGQEELLQEHRTPLYSCQSVLVVGWESGQCWEPGTSAPFQVGLPTGLPPHTVVACPGWASQDRAKWGLHGLWWPCLQNHLASLLPYFIGQDSHKGHSVSRGGDLDLSISWWSRGKFQKEYVELANFRNSISHMQQMCGGQSLEGWDLRKDDLLGYLFKWERAEWRDVFLNL